MKYLESMNQSHPLPPLVFISTRRATWGLERHKEPFTDRDIGSRSVEMCSASGIEQLEQVVCMEMDFFARKEISFNCQINWPNIFRHFGSVGMLLNNKYKFHRKRKLNFYLVFSSTRWFPLHAFVHCLKMRFDCSIFPLPFSLTHTSFHFCCSCESQVAIVIPVNFRRIH